MIHISSTLVEAEETVFSYFFAQSIAAVAALNESADVPFDRVVPAIAISWEDGGVGPLA